MDSLINYENFLKFMESIFVEENYLDDCVFKSILEFQKKGKFESVALFPIFDGVLSSKEKFHIYDDTVFLGWDVIKSSFFKSSKINTTTSFNFFTDHYSIYCFFIKSYGWLLISTIEPFTPNFLLKVEQVILSLEILVAKHLNKNRLIEKSSDLLLLELGPIFQNIIEDSTDSILISDLDGTLIYANKKSKEFLGIDDSDINKIKVYDYEKYFEGDKLNKWEAHKEELKIVDFQRTKGNLTNTKTGEVINTDVTIRYLSLAKKDYILAISKDATDIYKLEDILKKEAHLQEILLKMASQYINIDVSDIASLVNISLKEIAQFVGADRAYIFTYDFMNETTSNTYEWCQIGVPAEIDNLQNVPISFIPQWVKRHRKGLPFVIDDVSLLPDVPGGLKEILEPQGVKSLITLPMFAMDRLVGFVGFDSVSHKKYYSKREEKLLLVYAEILVNMELRQQYETELIQQKERFRKIISSTNLGLIEVDDNFDISFVNNSYMEFYGYESEGLLGQNVFEVFLSKKVGAILERKMGRMKNKEVLTIELETKNSRGLISPALVSIVKYDEGKNSKGYLGAVVDLSAQKELEKELRVAVKKMEEASSAKEQFFANISHELRTPLNIINGSLTEVSKRKISKDAHFLLDHAQIASRHMLNLVNNILDFAKINAGEIMFEPKAFNLFLALNETFNMFKLMAKEKLLDYKLNIDSKLHEYVWGDFGKINQVLINILGNAIKFTDTGFVRLNVDVVKDTSHNQTVRFTVTDTGIGVGKDFLEKIFEEYKQDILVNSTQSGTGLGMPISKKLISIMGGEIKVCSEKNEGTEIVFELAFDKREDLVYGKKNFTNKNLLRDKIILVAEDNYMNALILERKMSDLGAKVVKVENGQLALRALEHQHFDLIFMDIQMPVMGGLEATKIIREELGLSIPIIAVTANVFQSNIEECLAAGINDILIKPFEDQMLYTKTLNLIEPSTLISKSIKTTEKIQKSSIASDYSLEKLKKLSDGDQDFYQKMLRVFIEITDIAIQELDQAIRVKDLNKVAKTVHKIKPSTKDLDMHAVVGLIEVLETSEYKSVSFVAPITKELLKIIKKVVRDIGKNELKHQ
jgi:PAS domain S-box-containing protein